MRTLQNLHDGYARLLSTTLSSYLRTLVEIDIVSVDQLTYSEFMMSISNPSCIYVFQMEPLEGAAIFEVNPSLVFFIVDRLFGGQGKPSEHNRELTDIEKNVLTKIVERALLNLKEVWEHVGIFTPKIESYETNSPFVQIAPPNETIILISLEVRMKHGSGLISLCFPYMLLESVITKLSGAVIRTTHITGVVTDIGIELGKLLYRAMRWHSSGRDQSGHLPASGPNANTGYRTHLGTLVRLALSFFVGGVVGALGFKQLGYVFTVPLALVLVGLAGVPAVEDLLAFGRGRRVKRRRP
jgi:hypothetical protein